MPGRRIIGIWLMCLLQSGMLFAQWRKPRLSHLGPEEGMSASTFDIAQDSTGYMYFGTVEGLIRYDGSSFQLFSYDPFDSTSIGPGDVWCLLASSSGTIWAGTRLSGLNEFNPRSLTFRRYATPQRDTVDYDAVLAMYEDENHQLWLGGNHYMLNCFDPVTKTFETYIPDWKKTGTSSSSGSIISIYQDRFQKDILWLGMIDPYPFYSNEDATGLVAFNRKTKQFTSFPCRGNPRYQDDTGKIWLSSLALNRFDPVSGSCHSFPEMLDGKLISPVMRIRDLVPYKNEFIIVGAHNILTYTPDQQYQSLMTDPSKGIVENAFTDAEGNIWFGRNKGITVLSNREEKIRYYSLLEHGITERLFPGKLAYDALSHVLYIRAQGGPGKGREIYAIPMDQSPTSTLYSGRDPISGIVIDDQRRLWISTDKQFYILDLAHPTAAITPYALPCMSMMPAFWNLSYSPGGWIGGISDDEFTWFHPEKNSCHILRQSALPVAPGRLSSAKLQGVFFTDHQSALLFSNEIYQVDLESGEVSRLLMESGVNPYPLSEINSVIEDSRGHIWVASLAMTAEFSLQEDSLHLVKKYTSEDGLSFAWAHELYADDADRIWAFSSSGIDAINPITHEIRTFGVNEGLADPYIDPRQILTLREGSMATVNSNGVIVFHPDSLWNAYSLHYVPVVLKEVRIEGKALLHEGDVNFLNEVVLRPDQHYVDVRFQALAYPTDYNITYSYRVDGLREDWTPIGESKIVTLATLPPGDYTLHIKSGSPAGNGPEKILAIHVMTPWFRQSWFIFLSLFTIMGTGYRFYRRRIERIREQEEEKAGISRQIAELELKALRSQMNPHFMFNSLNSIKNYILHAEPKLAAEYLSNFSHLIRLILHHSSEKVITLKEELEILTLYVELEQIRFDNRFDFRCIIDDTLHLEQIVIPPMLLQPYVENAIWHGLMHKKEKGHLTLQFRAEQHQVACIIDDDGIGRAKAAELKSLSASRYKSMGMGITRDRIDIMNKMDALGITTTIEDKQDIHGQPAGTKVIIRIPDYSPIEKDEL